MEWTTRPSKHAAGGGTGKEGCVADLLSVERWMFPCGQIKFTTGRLDSLVKRERTRLAFSIFDFMPLILLFRRHGPTSALPRLKPWPLDSKALGDISISQLAFDHVSLNLRSTPWTNKAGRTPVRHAPEHNFRTKLQSPTIK